MDRAFGGSCSEDRSLCAASGTADVGDGRREFGVASRTPGPLDRRLDLCRPASPMQPPSVQAGAHKVRDGYRRPGPTSAEHEVEDIGGEALLELMARANELSARGSPLRSAQAHESPKPSSHLLNTLATKLKEHGLSSIDLPRSSGTLCAMLAELGFDSALDRARLKKELHDRAFNVSVPRATNGSGKVPGRVGDWLLESREVTPEQDRKAGSCMDSPPLSPSGRLQQQLSSSIDVDMTEATIANSLASLHRQLQSLCAMIRDGQERVAQAECMTVPVTTIYNKPTSSCLTALRRSPDSPGSTTDADAARSRAFSFGLDVKTAHAPHSMEAGINVRERKAGWLHDINNRLDVLPRDFGLRTIDNKLDALLANQDRIARIEAKLDSFRVGSNSITSVDLKAEPILAGDRLGDKARAGTSSSESAEAQRKEGNSSIRAADITTRGPANLTTSGCDSACIGEKLQRIDGMVGCLACDLRRATSGMEALARLVSVSEVRDILQGAMRSFSEKLSKSISCATLSECGTDCAVNSTANTSNNLLEQVKLQPDKPLHDQPGDCAMQTSAKSQGSAALLC